MSAVLVLTPVLAPIVVGGWPAITAGVAGAAAAMGLAVKSSAKETTKAEERAKTKAETTAEVALSEESELAQSLLTEEEIVLTKGTVTLRVRRDARGRASVCASGPGHTDAELKAMAQEFAQRMTQCVMYNRIMTEVKARGFQVIDEEQMQDETVRIHLRRWQE